MSSAKRARAAEAARRSSAAKYRPTGPDNRIPETRGMALGSDTTCWCGQPRGHTWPGKEAGDPHPRETQ